MKHKIIEINTMFISENIEYFKGNFFPKQSRD